VRFWVAKKEPGKLKTTSKNRRLIMKFINKLFR